MMNPEVATEYLTQLSPMVSRVPDAHVFQVALRAVDEMGKRWPEAEATVASIRAELVALYGQKVAVPGMTPPPG